MTTLVIPFIPPEDDFDPEILQLAEEKLGRASIWLLRNEPFYATLFMRLRRVPFHGTMGVDLRTLYYDPKFVLSLTDFELRFILIHEVCHIIFRHPIRCQHRDHRLWNDAADYVINNLIVKDGQERQRAKGTNDPSYDMPRAGLNDPVYDGLTTEEVYRLIEKKQKGGKGQGDNDSSGNDQQQSDGRWGEVFDQPGNSGGGMTPEEIDAAEQDMRRAVIQAENVAKTKGLMSINLQSAIDELREPTRAWQDVLREMLVERIPKDFSFEKPNRMYTAMGADIIMPTTTRYGLGHVAFFIDDSGSVSQGEMAQFASDCQFIFDELQPECITVIHFDHSAAEPETYESGDDFKLVRRKHGGTRFAAPFEKAEELGLDADFDVCIFLTDGADYDFPKHEPCYPVIWGTTGAFIQGGPPFGDVLPIKFREED